MEDEQARAGGGGGGGGHMPDQLQLKKKQEYRISNSSSVTQQVFDSDMKEQ